MVMAEPVTRFFTRYFESPEGKIAIVTMDNGRDYKKPNTFGEKALVSLQETLEQIAGDSAIQGLLLTGKPYGFAAGADLSEVPFITTFEQGYRIGKQGHTVMRRLMDLPFPTVAAINGAALGGGLEIALYCRYRTVVSSVQHIGFPECFLGLIPGWGGCTLGTKLLGPEKSLELIIRNALNQNRMINGSKAYEMGLADRLFPDVEFLDESLRFLGEVISGKVTVERREVDCSQVERLIEEARRFIDGKVHGAAPAPYRALDLIEGACRWDVEKGFEEENKALGDLIKSRQCKASIYSFDLVNRYAKKPRGVPELPPRAVTKVGIAGAGLMASQLAQLFIERLSVPVVMKDVNREVLESGMARVRRQFETLVERKKISEEKARYFAGLLKGTLAAEDFADCDFILEAVFEKMEVKKEVFSEIEAQVSETAILATNTSSLSVSDMASGLRNPERVVGFHFFNPVAVLPLVEIVKGKKTDEATLATAHDLSKKLKKTSILVKDSPAFLVNRILTRMLVDCLQLVEEGASVKEVDESLLALGLPMAPFELLGLVGLPVAQHVMETLNQAYGPERFPLNANFRKLVDRKITSLYTGEGPTRQVNPEVEALWERTQTRMFHPEEIRERVLSNLARETDLILKEGVVDSPRDVDLALLLGAGWPFFMGGLTMHLDLTGITPKVLQKVFFSL